MKDAICTSARIGAIVSNETARRDANHPDHGPQTQEVCKQMHVTTPTIVRNPMRVPIPLTPVTIIVIPSYRRFRMMANSRAYSGDDCFWFPTFALAQAWIDRCIERGVRLDAKFVIKSW